MIQRSWWAVCVLVGGTIVASGCSQKSMDAFFAASVADQREFTKLVIDDIDKHDVNMSTQHKKMHPEAEAEINASRAQFEKDLAKIRADVDNVHSSVGTIIGDVQNNLLRLAGIPTGGTVKDVMVAGDKVINDGLVKQREALLANIAAMEKELTAAAKEQLEKLDDETKAKFAGVSDETGKKLMLLRGDQEKFNAALRDELQLTPAQKEQLNGMTTEQILALIAAAGGAAGVGLVGGRSGKSRGALDIEKLKENAAAMKADIERWKPAPKE